MDTGHQEVSIILHIVEGRVNIKSAKDFEKTLAMFPNRPELHKVYADFLYKQKSFVLALHEYGRAAALFIEAGMPLQAIGAKIKEWKISAASEEELQILHKALRQSGSSATILEKFAARLAFDEAAALFRSMGALTLSSGKEVVGAGQPEDALYFVLSGKLDEVVPGPPRGKRGTEKKSGRQFVVNDFFGNVFPLDSGRNAEKTITSRTKVDLLKIPKAALLGACEKFPGITKFLQNLYEHAGDIAQEAQLNIRESSRQQLVIPVVVEINPDKQKKDQTALQGMSSDISLGGVLFKANTHAQHLNLDALVGEKAKVLVGTPDDGVLLGIRGRLAWWKQGEAEEKSTVFLGIQFDKLPASLHGLLIIFANAIGAAREN